PVRRGEDVAVVERLADAHGNRLLADRHVQEAGQLARPEALLDLLLEAPDQQHLPQESAQAILAQRPFPLDLRHDGECKGDPTARASPSPRRCKAALRGVLSRARILRIRALPASFRGLLFAGGEDDSRTVGSLMLSPVSLVDLCRGDRRAAGGLERSLRRGRALLERLPGARGAANGAAQSGPMESGRTGKARTSWERRRKRRLGRQARLSLPGSAALRLRRVAGDGPALLRAPRRGGDSGSGARAARALGHAARPDAGAGLVPRRPQRLTRSHALAAA